VSVCVSVCPYVFQEKTIYIVALLHKNWIHNVLAQQLKQVQLLTLLRPLVGNSLNQADSLNQAWPYVETAIR
jgi:hypothetical protein